MKLAPGQYGSSRTSPIPSFLWWTLYLIGGVWAQELSGGADFFSPGVLVCMQSRQWLTTAWLTAVWIFLQEGTGNFAFGVSLLFYGGMYFFYFISHWLLEPENPVFIFFFSFCLASWLYLVLAGAATFQEIPVEMPNAWSWIGKQWLLYVGSWGLSLFIYKKWVRHGNI